MSNPLKLALLPILALLLLACAPIVDSAQPVMEEPSIILSGGGSIGQTFVARYDGLAGVKLNLSPMTNLEGELLLYLRPGPKDDQTLITASMPTEALSESGLYSFVFEPQKGSRGTYYYFFVEFRGQGNLKLSAAPGDAYLDGLMYQDHAPTDQQLAFHLIYNPSSLIWGLVKEHISRIGILIITLFIYVVPGFALLVLLYPNSSSSRVFTKLALASGISTALYPILFLWTDIFNLHLGSLYAWLPGIAGTIFLVWHFRHWRPSLRFGYLLRKWMNSGSFLSDVTLLVVIGLSLLVRFNLIRSLDMPLWGDSVHHTMITQLMVQNNGLFDTWEPLAELQSLTYHFGFHANAAILQWLTGVSVPQAVLLMGQIFNFLAVFTLLPLVQKIGGRRWGSVIVLCIAGLLSPMPSFYLNWGRYTQIAGQVILPVVVYFIWEVLEDKPRNLRLIALTCIVLAGLGLTHYRILIFAIIFLFTILLFNLRKGKFKQVLLSSIWVTLGTGIIFLPWFINTFAGKITPNFIRTLATPANEVRNWTQQYNAINNLFGYLPPVIWLLFFLALLTGLLRKNRGIAVLAAWWGFLLLATNPQWLRLPGEGAISNFAFFIAAYLPAAVIIGGVIGDAIGEPSQPWKTIISVALISLGLWGTSMRLEDLNVRDHSLATRPDIRAAEWIKDNTPLDAKFLTNAFFAYDDTVIVGSDGGWWIRLLAERDTTLPPISYGSEKGPRTDYRQWVNALSAEIAAKGFSDPDVLSMLQDRDVTHVYIGQRNGSVNYNGPDTLSIDTLLTNEHFHLIYHEDRVWIFEILDSEDLRS